MVHGRTFGMDRADRKRRNIHDDGDDAAADADDDDDADDGTTATRCDGRCRRLRWRRRLVW